MAEPRDVLLSARDADALSLMLGDWPRLHPMEAEAALALASTLGAARIVAADRMPAEVVHMGSTVTYLDHASGRRHTVTVVYPAQADAGMGRVSVLSPIGRALLGRGAGSEADALLPTGRRFSARIEEVTRRRSKDAEALALA